MATGADTDITPKAQEVMDYLSTHEINQRLNDVVNSTVRARADDPFAFMAQQLLSVAQPPTISSVSITMVLAPDGLFEGIQADVYSWLPSSLIHMGRGTWRNGCEVANEIDIATSISNLLKSKPLKADSLIEIDKSLLEWESKSATKAIPAVSIAVARALSHATRQDLFTLMHRAICSDPEVIPRLPIPLIDVASFSVPRMASFGIMPMLSNFSLRQLYETAGAVYRSAPFKKKPIPSIADLTEYPKPDELLTLLEEALSAAGFQVGDQVALWFDAGAVCTFNAASDEYDFGDGASISREELLAQYQTLLSQHTSLALIIDPFHPDDPEAWDLWSSSSIKGCAAASTARHAPCSIVTVSMRTTVSDFLAASQTIAAAKTDFIAAGSDGQMDEAIADLAVASSARYCRFGPMNMGFNSKFYNRLLLIDDMIQALK